MEPILKSEIPLKRHSYNNGIDITNFSTSPRKIQNAETEIGVSTKTFGNKWFETSKGKALFKTFDGDKFVSIPGMRALNEVLCYKLAKKMDVPCAEYEFANIGEHKGVLTYDIFENCDRVINAEEFLKVNESYLLMNNNYSCYQCAITNNQDFVEFGAGYILDQNDLLLNIYKYAIFDFLTLQADRHLGNICFKIKNKDGKDLLKIAPLFDNEIAFGARFISKDVKPKDVISNLEKLMGENYDKISKVTVYNPSKFGGLKKEALAIVELAKYYPQYKQALLTEIKNFNIKEVLNELKTEGASLSEQEENYYISLGEHVKNILNESIRETFTDSELSEDEPTNN